MERIQTRPIDPTAAMDVNRKENSPISAKYNITGFPTLLFFENGELQYPYPGENNKEVC